jgi:hypothetical protein
LSLMSTTTALAFLAPVVPSAAFAISYANPKSTPLWTLSLLVLSYSFTATSILLLPLDLSTEDYESSIDSGWKVNYWLTFILAWVVLPISLEYLQSGYLAPRARLADALRTNMRFYMYAGIGGVVLYLLLLAFGGGMNVIHFLMAAGNTYGLLLVVLLLGYGLVSIPRSMMSKASPHEQLERRYLLASTIDTDLYESVWELQDVEECVEKILLRRSSTHDPDVLDYLSHLSSAMELNSIEFSSEMATRRMKTGRR